MFNVRVKDFYKKADDLVIPVDDDKVFLPDRAWSKTFAAGLEKIDFSGRHVIEVGVGSGINMVGLITCERPPASFLGTDISDDAVSASNSFAAKKRLPAVCFKSDLLSDIDDQTLGSAHDIIGCIPQVPCQPHAIISTRALSDYYEETGIKEDAFGLGLVARLLDQTRERASEAVVTLNIAGRPGEHRITDLYESRGYEVEIMHSARVKQDAGTSLKSLVEIEQKTGLCFHFYKSVKEENIVCAAEAETLRVKNVPIYHDLYVIRAKLG